MNKDEMKMIEQIRKDFVARCLKGSDGCNLRDCQHCHAESLYNAGYRKVGKNEIVVKKSKIGMLEKTISYLEMEKAQLNKQLATVKQETTREVLQKVKDILQGDYNIPLPLAQLYQENGIYYGGKI